MTTLRIGTRASALAQAQSTQVADLLAARTGRETALVKVSTEGDVNQRPLTEFGGAGVFVSAVREALLAGEVDVAVHSLKDLPTAPAPGITLAAVPLREDPRDAVVARDGLTLGELPPGSTVGTGSPRRAAQLRALGLGLEVQPVRGNVGTRIGLVTDGRLDAVVLAYAGLRRVGLADQVTEVLDPLQMLPAPGQGALAVECRADEPELVEQLREALDDPASRTAVSAERSVLAALEAGCSAPVGALAEVALGEVGEEVWIRAVAAAVDGTQIVKMSTSGAVDDPVGLGQALARKMIADGASALLGERVSSPTATQEEKHSDEHDRDQVAGQAKPCKREAGQEGRAVEAGQGHGGKARVEEADLGQAAAGEGGHRQGGPEQVDAGEATSPGGLRVVRRHGSGRPVPAHPAGGRPHP
jgi:hydroxymethylbilane synthase